MLNCNNSSIVSVFFTTVFFISGCSSERIVNNSSVVYENRISQPAPIQSAPMARVSQQVLPPLDEPAEEKINPVEQEQKISSPDIPKEKKVLKPENVAGVWKVWIDGMTCQIATPQTKSGSGYRAGPLHCPDVLSGIKSWNVKGSKLTFYDDAGKNIANLYSSGGSYFEGITSSGTKITLGR